MKKCLACGATYPVTSHRCSACSAEPDRRDGFIEYAPDLSREGSGFKASYFADLARLEEGYFWFRARNNLIIWALTKYCSQFGSLLEIGCGTGYVLSGIAKAFPDVLLHGSEIFSSGLAFAAARQPKIDFMQMDARQIPFVDEFDAIGAFDVLEHVEEDDIVLSEIHNALKPHGVVLLTVPQHRWMWSSIDDLACHARRYPAKRLHEKIKTAGFEILRSTSFVSVLLPIMFLSRMVQKFVPVKDTDSLVGTKISPALNRLLEAVLNVETALIRGGVDLPIGGSRLIVAKKNDAGPVQ